MSDRIGFLIGCYDCTIIAGIRDSNCVGVMVSGDTNTGVMKGDLHAYYILIYT